MPPAKKTTPKKPPTLAQLDRVKELLEHPALDEYISNVSPERFNSMIQTQGGTGILIGLLKKQIEYYEAKKATQR